MSREKHLNVIDHENTFTVCHLNGSIKFKFERQRNCDEYKATSKGSLMNIISLKDIRQKIR